MSRASAGPQAEVDPLAALGSLTVWKDGRLLPGHGAISAWDHGLLYGDGVFEGIRLRDDRLYRVDLHLERLSRSSRIVGLGLRFGPDEIIDAIRQVARANGLTDAHVRIIHTRGVGLPGLDPRRCPVPTLLVMAYPFPPYLGSQPLSLIVSSVVRKSPRSIDAAVKSLNYLDGILAKMQANEAGAADALMLDAEGFVAEATAANAFVVRDGVLRTPPTTAALAGITRRTVLELAEPLGIPTSVERLTPGDFYTADEAFLTGTATGIVAIGSVDGRRLTSAPGSMTERLIGAYRATWAEPAFATTL